MCSTCLPLSVWETPHFAYPEFHRTHVALMASTAKMCGIDMMFFIRIVVNQCIYFKIILVLEQFHFSSQLH